MGQKVAVSIPIKRSLYALQMYFAVRDDVSVQFYHLAIHEKLFSPLEYNNECEERDAKKKMHLCYLKHVDLSIHLGKINFLLACNRKLKVFIVATCTAMLLYMQHYSCIFSQHFVVLLIPF